MASIKCRECGTDVSKAASACPRCGEPISHTFKARLTQLFVASTFLAVMLGLAFLLGIVDPSESEAARPGSHLEAPAPLPKQSSEQLAVEVACNLDLQCLGDRHQMITLVHCLPIIEKSANYAANWTTDWFEPKFSHAIWVSQKRQVIGYIGDKLEFQDAAGTLIPHTYRCDYDIEKQRIVDIKILPGAFSDTAGILLGDLRSEYKSEPIPVTLPPQRPTFDCAQSQSRAEQLICTHEELARRDVLISAMLENARAVASNPAQFDKDTQAARQQLEATCFDKTCVIAWYYHRATVLAALSNHQTATIEGARNREAAQSQIRPGRASRVS